MIRTLLILLLLLPAGYSNASALIDLNALSTEVTLAIDEVAAQDTVASKDKTVDKVEVTRRQRGLLFALLPITFTVKAVAYPDGRVLLTYPWYSAITVDREEEIRAKVKIAVDTARKARLVGTVRAAGESVNPKFTREEAVVVEEKILEVLSTSFKNNSDTQYPQ